MPKLPARIVGLSVVALALISLIAGGFWQVRHIQASETVIHILEFSPKNPAAVRDKALEYALKHGGDPNATSDYGDAPPDSVRSWVRAFLPPRFPGQSAMTMAMSGRDVAAVRLLVAQGANVNARDSVGRTYIMQVAEFWYVPWTKAESKADAQDIAQYRRQEEANFSQILAILLSHGANVNALTSDGETALMAATAYHNPACAALLVRNGANVNAVADDGETALGNVIYPALHQPVSSRVDPDDSVTLSLLLAHGANPNVKMPDGSLPLDEAYEWGEAKYVKILRAHGARRN